MIFFDELTRKRLKRFRHNRRGYYSFLILMTMCLLSLLSEFFANSKPAVLVFDGKVRVPAVFDYHPSEFGQDDKIVTDYRKLDESKINFEMWPVVQWDPFEQNTNIANYPGAPSKYNWLGTDDRGRDVLSRLIYGLRYSMGYAVLVWLLSFTIGSLLGGAMGYLGGRVDMIGQRLVEVLSTVPQFFLLIIVVSIFQPNLFWLVGLSSAFGWISISYYVRGEFLKLRKLEFVEAARALGAGPWRIIVNHLLPNSLGPVITYSPFFISASVVSLAALDFLGFGLPAPTPSWGELLAQAQKLFTTAWWLALYPSMALFGTLILLSLIGEAVRDAFDPKKVIA